MTENEVSIPSITTIMKYGIKYLSIANFNGATVKVHEWIRNFTSHFTGHVVTYLFWD